MTAPADAFDPERKLEFIRSARKSAISVTVGYNDAGQVYTETYQMFQPGPRTPLPVAELVKALRDAADVLEMAGPEAVL